MSRSGLRQLMTTQQMKIQASYLAKYEQVSTLIPAHTLVFIHFLICLTDNLTDIGVSAAGIAY